MPIPRGFEGRLAIPAIAAPMFRTSGPDLVVAACQAGVIGAFPSLNQRTTEELEACLVEVEERLLAFEQIEGRAAAPHAVNLIVHRANRRWEDDLAVVLRHRVPLIISSLGAVSDLVRRAHDRDRLVFHDVTTMHHAEKAAAAGVDGLILVCAGAGGHAGTLSPFALIPEVKKFFGGTIVLAGCISTGDQILAAEALGADLAYLGTRFLATVEALCPEEIKRMVLESRAGDIVRTAAFSGIAGNYLAPSLRVAGFDPDRIARDTDGGPSLDEGERRRARKSVWSAGQGCGCIDEILSTSALCRKLIQEYHGAAATLLSRSIMGGGAARPHPEGPDRRAGGE
jgi:nitronate monooxygenase